MKPTYVCACFVPLATTTCSSGGKHSLSEQPVGIKNDGKITCTYYVISDYMNR